MLYLRAWRMLMRFFDLKNVTEIKHILKGNPQKIIKMNAGKKQRYILVQ